jgi:nucleoid-associated protein YgaU
MTTLRSAPPRAWLVLAVSGLGFAGSLPAQESATSRYPITTEQRRIADQVAQAGVPLSALASNAPDTYTVKRGDTLWDISSVFLTSPWRWPELWGMNRQQIANPHLIYPGQTLVLVKGADGRARLQVADRATLPGGPGDAVRLSPRVRDVGAEQAAAIPSIPNNLIEPFLSQPAVVEANELAKYPRIVATQEGRVNIGRGDTAYARGVAEDRVENFHVFRPARPLYDPDDVARKSPIAYEAFYLGTARLAKRGEIATVRIQDSKQEIGVGDRLVPIERQPLIAYVPRRPERAVDGRIVSVYSGVDQAGPQSIVTLNRGRTDGLEIGHVLALLETGATVLDRTAGRREFIKLPDERIGEMFVFRVFERISYALIMNLSKPVKVGDRFTQPDDLQFASSEPRPAASALPAAAPVGGPVVTTPLPPQTVTPGAAPKEEPRR